MDQEVFTHYTLHIKERDDEHKAIFDNIDIAYDAIRHHDVNKIFHSVRVVNDLSRIHFKHEEQYMDEVAFPFREHHKLKHIDLKRKLDSLNIHFGNKEHVASMGKALANHYISVFEKAFLMHIDHDDRQYAEFIASR